MIRSRNRSKSRSKSKRQTMKRFKVTCSDRFSNRGTLYVMAWDGAHAAKLVQEQELDVDVIWAGQEQEQVQVHSKCDGTLERQLKRSIDQAQQRKLFR
jgi:hypothetical protein